MNEAETRAEHIDPALKAAGWGVAEGSRVHREYHIAPALVPKTFIFANSHYQGYAPETAEMFKKILQDPPGWVEPADRTHI
jgi:hypothetical protein